jgi:transposase
MADPFTRGLADGARILGEFEGRPLQRYGSCSSSKSRGVSKQFVFDNAHGDHDMHRYTGSEKQPAERFAEGAVNEIAPQAIDYLIDHWEAIADSWRS